MGSGEDRLATKSTKGTKEEKSFDRITGSNRIRE
jgi:hypothetical protein